MFSVFSRDGVKCQREKLRKFQNRPKFYLNAYVTKTVMLRRSNLSAGTKAFCPQSHISHFKSIISISLVHVFLVDLGIKGRRSARISRGGGGASLPPPSLLYHGGGMTLRVRPRVKIIADTTALEIISGSSISLVNVVTVCFNLSILSLKQCTVKQLVLLVFVISGTVKVSVIRPGPRLDW